MLRINSLLFIPVYESGVLWIWGGGKILHLCCYGCISPELQPSCITGYREQEPSPFLFLHPGNPMGDPRDRQNDGIRISFLSRLSDTKAVVF